MYAMIANIWTLSITSSKKMPLRLNFEILNVMAEIRQVLTICILTRFSICQVYNTMNINNTYKLS
jgi:hypothetical protein